MSEPIRILHVFGTTNLGGAESRTMDLYRYMDRERIQFDFLVHTGERGHYDEEINQLGGRIYRVPRFRLYNYFAYRQAMKAFFKEHNEFRCVQGHMTSTAAIYLPIAKKGGVAITAAHARSAGVDSGLKGKMTRFMRRNLSRKTDYMFACSGLAGEAVFGSQAMEQGKVIYIPNAIDAVQYRFSQSDRDALRKELGLSERFVIGHVGRFDYAKNHRFLIRVFDAIQKQRADASLILLGDGSGMQEIKELVRDLGISDRVLFLGNKSNIPRFYQIMDYFVFPSRFEGLPGTVIEAQAAGLRCLISDAIAKEVMITPLVQAESTRMAPEVWAEKVLKTAAYIREDMYADIVRSGFDVKVQAEKMMRFYESGNGEELV